jgi:hypothetical protein
MSLKKIDFIEYTNEELFQIRKNLSGTIANLPEKIQNYIKTENPVSGNVSTRIYRCYKLIDVEIVERFVVGLIK